MQGEEPFKWGGSMLDLGGKIINVNEEGNKLLRKGNMQTEEDDVGTIDFP